MIFWITVSSSSIFFIQAFLYENGTCTNEKLNESLKQVINTNGTVDDFLKSLPSDNTVLAEIVCQNRTMG
jgi:hypothetical protein